jgi:predicted flap endonuclease-1-like 5' DNA nuclease
MFNLANLHILFMGWIASPLLEEAEASDNGLPWWATWLIILAVIVLFVLLWWWLNRPKKTEAPPVEPAARSVEVPVAEVKPLVVEAPAPAAPPVPDDLTVLEGIGPKIASVLQAAGITTFAQLAATDLSRIQQILQEADLRLADPSSWAEQASLAAAGKWDEFKTLTDSLKGGRKVA